MLQDFIPDAAPQPGALFHSLRQVQGLEWQAELDLRSYEADAWGLRISEADAAVYLELADADAQRELAACEAKRAGLVNVSTTDTRSARPRSLSGKRIQRAKCEALADAASAHLRAVVDKDAVVYVPPADAMTRRIRHLRRSVSFSARSHLVSERGHRSDDCVMLTLTYHHGGDWRPEHVSGLLKTMREFMRRRKLALRYTWVAELQQRGVIHYHVALFLPRGFRIPYPDKCGWWPHGSTNLTRSHNPVGYLMKYISKGKTKVGNWLLPMGARMFGVGGLEHSLKRARRWFSLPGFVQQVSAIDDKWRRAAAGQWRGSPAGWVSPDGEIMPSEFRRCRVGSELGFMRVHTHARPSLRSNGYGSDLGPLPHVEASGPFSWWKPTC